MPSGISTSMFLRLCSRAPVILIDASDLRRDFGTESIFAGEIIARQGLESRFARWHGAIDLPLAIVGTRASARSPESLQRPLKTNSPPRSPRPGPMSIR